MLKTTKSNLSLILSAFCLTITTFNQEAYALSANARTSVKLESNASKSDNDRDPGKYTLGKQEIKCGKKSNNTDKIEEDYSSTFNKKNKTEKLEFEDSCKKDGKVTTVDASSTMKVTRKTEEKGKEPYFDWNLNLKANATRQKKQNKKSPFGLAIARGEDPQFFGAQTFPNQIFQEEVTLEKGASVFAEDEQDMASMTFSRGIEFDQELAVVENPFFSIKILASGPSSKTTIINVVDSPPISTTTSSVDAMVNFNPNKIPGLVFSMTASDLEDLLEDEDNGLGTSSGLKDDISFSYSWDYSNFDLTSNPRLVGGGENLAQSGISTTVPEPTSTIGFIAFGAIGAASTLKRKVQSSKEKS